MKRDEERMLDVLEYLTTGTVLVAAPGGIATSETLSRLIALSGLARSLQVKDLEEKVCAILAAQKKLPLETFVQAATACCAHHSGIDVSPHSALGTWIREFLAANLKELEKAGCIKRITEKGGKLTGILVQVLMEAQQSNS